MLSPNADLWGAVISGRQLGGCLIFAPPANVYSSSTFFIEAVLRVLRIYSGQRLVYDGILIDLRVVWSVVYESGLRV